MINAKNGVYDGHEFVDSTRVIKRTYIAPLLTELLLTEEFRMWPKLETDESK